MSVWVVGSTWHYNNITGARSSTELSEQHLAWYTGPLYIIATKNFTVAYKRGEVPTFVPPKGAWMSHPNQGWVVLWLLAVGFTIMGRCEMCN